MIHKMKLQYKRWGGVDAFYKCSECNGGTILTMSEYPEEIELDCYMCGLEYPPKTVLESTTDTIAVLC